MSLPIGTIITVTLPDACGYNSPACLRSEADGGHKLCMTPVMHLRMSLSTRMVSPIA